MVPPRVPPPRPVPDAPVPPVDSWKTPKDPCVAEEVVVQGSTLTLCFISTTTTTSPVLQITNHKCNNKQRALRHASTTTMMKMHSIHLMHHCHHRRPYPSDAIDRVPAHSY